MNSMHHSLLQQKNPSRAKMFSPSTITFSCFLLIGSNGGIFVGAYPRAQWIEIIAVEVREVSQILLVLMFMCWNHFRHRLCGERIGSIQCCNKGRRRGGDSAYGEEGTIWDRCRQTNLSHHFRGVRRTEVSHQLVVWSFILLTSYISDAVYNECMHQRSTASEWFKWFVCLWLLYSVTNLIIYSLFCELNNLRRHDEEIIWWKDRIGVKQSGGCCCGLQIGPGSCTHSLICVVIVLER